MIFIALLRHHKQMELTVLDLSRVSLEPGGGHTPIGSSGTSCVFHQHGRDMHRRRMHLGSKVGNYRQLVREREGEETLGEEEME